MRIPTTCAAIMLLLSAWLVPCPASHATDAVLLPDDTELIAVVHVKNIFQSELVKSQPDAWDEVKDALRRFAGIGRVEECLNGTGIDVFRDVTSVTYACTRAVGPQASFLVLQGNFKSSSFTSAAKEIATRDGKTQFAKLVNPKTLIIALSKESINDALARAAGSKKSGLKKELRELLEASGDKQSIGFVSTGTALANRLNGVAVPNIETAASFMKTLNVVGGGMTLADDIQLRIMVNAGSEDTAKKLAESSSSGLRMLYTLTQQNAALDKRYRPVEEFVKSLRTDNQGPSIIVRGRLTLDQVAMLMKQFPVASTSDRKVK